MFGLSVVFTTVMGYISAATSDCFDLQPRDCADPFALSNICQDSLSAAYCRKSCGLCGPQQLTCRVCSHLVASPDACTRKQTCLSSQICHTGISIVQTAIRYEFGCIEKHACVQFIKNGIIMPFGKRQSTSGVRVCDACCMENDCNRKGCFQLLTNMTLGAMGITTTAHP